jgi:hypothetical protein
MRKNRSNLNSVNGLAEKCCLNDLAKWAKAEADHVGHEAHRKILLHIIDNIDEFAKWPSRSLLLIEGVTRREKYHQYPENIVSSARHVGIRLDRRTNGPAIAAFEIAGGNRPVRFGSTNKWSIHHIYSGKFPYISLNQTLHAAYDGRHMSQSAGLVAVHPVLDAILDEYPFMSWLFRAQSFVRFGYDPDGAFSQIPGDSFGFHESSSAIGVVGKVV